MESIREVLRRALMGKRYASYWRSLRAAELKRYGYDGPVKGKGRRNNEGQPNGRA